MKCLFKNSPPFSGKLFLLSLSGSECCVKSCKLKNQGVPSFLFLGPLTGSFCFFPRSVECVIKSQNMQTFYSRLARRRLLLFHIYLFYYFATEITFTLIVTISGQSFAHGAPFACIGPALEMAMLPQPILVAIVQLRIV